MSSYPPIYNPVEASLIAEIEDDPRDWLAVLQLGTFYRENNRPIDALKAYRKAVEVAPDEGKPHAELGAALLAMDQIDGAERALARALELDPSDALTMSNLGHLRTIQERFPEATTLLEDAVKRMPGEPSLHNNLAALYARTGRMEEAMHASRRALELNPDFVAARQNLGVAAFALGKFEEAAEALDLVLDFDPGNIVALILGGQAHLRTGRKPEGIRRLHRLTQMAPHSNEGEAAARILSEMKEEHETFVGLAWKEAAAKADAGVEQMQANEFDTAEQSFLEAIATCPGPPPGPFFEALASSRAATGRVLDACDAFYRGLAATRDPSMPLRFARFLMSIEDYFHAIVMLQETLQRGDVELDDRIRESVKSIIDELKKRLAENSSPPMVEAALDTYSQARRAQQENRVEEARQLIEAAIQAYPRNLDACWILSRIFHRVNDFRNMAQMLEAFARFFPGLGDVQFNTAVALRQSAQAEKALHYFENAVKLHPENPAYRTDYANTLHSLGRAEEAKQQIEEATRVGPRSALAWYNRALMEKTRGEDDAARDSMQKALDLAPRGPVGAVIRGRARTWLKS